MIKRFIASMMLFVAPLFAQQIPYSNIVLSGSGRPVGGAQVAVCSTGLVTTSAQVISNIGVFTMSANPIADGFATGMQLQVQGFTGADTYLNAGTITNGVIVGGYTILAVSSSTVSVSLPHASATATSNGTLFQQGNISTPCAPLSFIYADQLGQTPIAQPGLISDGIGNYAFYALPGIYNIQYYGSAITTTVRPAAVASGTATATTSTAANLPTAPALNALAIVTDGQGSNCITGGGATRELCQWTGSFWALVSAASSFSIPVTAAQGGTGQTALSAHGVVVGEGTGPVVGILPSNNAQCFMSAPSNFATTDPLFQTCPSGGGGGSPSVGAQGQIQEVGGSAGTFNFSPITDVGGAGTEIQVSTQTEFKGPAPEVDVSLFNARTVPVNQGAPFNAAGVNATCINGNATISISGAGFTRFLNGDGIDIYTCGPTHSMSTPSAPTVTSAIAITNTHTGWVVTNGSAGSVNNRCYVIVARDLAQGLTAKSAEACVTGGSAILGADPINVTSCSRSVQTVTCLTSAHTLPVGCTAGSCGGILINGTSDNKNFGGWFPLSSVPDATHFTYIGGLSAANGATTSSTGGTFEYFNSDHLALPAYTAGQWQYGIYEGASGAETLVGVSEVNVAALAGVPTYLTWDYYGSTYSGNSSLPLFWPSTPPSSPTNDSLVTTIVSGGGSSSLVVAAAPSNSITGTALFDDCPTVQAANNFANNSTGGGGMTTFNAAPSFNAGQAYIFNSSCALGGSISQSMPLNLYDTMRFAGKWYGDKNSNALLETLAPFGIEKHIPINDVRANPGIYFTGGRMEGVGLVPTGNNYVGMFYVSPTMSIFQDMAFGSINANDYNGVPFYDFEPLSGAFGWIMNNVVFISGPGQVSGSSFTPLLIRKNNYQTHLNNTPMCCRGMFFQPASFGEDLSVDQKQETQGLTEPQYSFYYGQGGNVGGWASFYNIFGDTTAQPSFVNFDGQGTGASNSLGIQLSITGANNSGSGIPLISGAPFASVVLKNVGVSTAQLGQNVNLHVDGGVQGEQVFDTSVILGASNTLFTNTIPQAAPTCSTATAGPPFTQAFTSSTFQYAPVFFGGGIGTLSSPSNSCTSDGITQQVSLVIPSAIPGAIGYIFDRTGTQLFSSLSPVSCAVPTSTTLTTLMGQNCGSFPVTFSTGGPAGISNGQVWGDLFPNAPNNVANALPSFTGGKLIATPCVPSTAGDECYWNGSGWTRAAGNTTTIGISEQSAAGLPSFEPRPIGSLVGTGQSNTFTAGVQDFSGVTEFRPQSGLTSALPATCTGPTPMDVYIATDAQAGRNWYFCTSTNVWTQQLNTGFLGLNSYGSTHTLLASESWANFTATATATIPHANITNRWVVYCVSPCATLTLAPDSGNITLNNVTASTVTVTTGLGAELTCNGTNCFAYGLGGSGGGGSGTVSSGTVNGPAYYSAATTVASATPPTTPNGVPSVLTSTPSGGVSQPPVMSLPGIAGRAVSGTAATDTILSTDCNPNRVEYIGSVAVAVTLPTATTLGVPKCVFKLVNTTVPPQTVTITPTTWTMNGNATLPLGFGQQLWVYVDPNSATNWVADQTDLVGNVSGGAVPASAKLTGTNSSSQFIAAALANTHIYVGSAGNLPVDVAVSGDESIANTGAVTNTGINGATLPASAPIVGTNSSKQVVAGTGHSLAAILTCSDSSGSGTAQTCTTAPTFTPVANDCMTYTTTTTNSGAGLTINWDALGAKSVAIPGASGWTTTLTASIIPTNKPLLACYDGTNINIVQTGTAAAGGGGTPCTTTALSLQYNNAGAFGCLAEFTYASSTITASSTGKIDLTSASVTAGFHLPSAAGAAPTNGGIFSYDTTNNRFVGGNAVNTSIFPWFIAAPTTNVLRKASGTLGLQIDSSITDNGTTIASPEPLVLGTANCTTFGTAGAICAGEGTAPTNVSATAAIYPDSTAHELEVATNGSTSFGMLVRRQPGAIHQTAQTAAITTATLCAASAGACNVAGQYHVHFTFIETGTACGTPATGGVTFLLTWTDSNATAHSAVSLGFDDASAINAVSQTFHFQTSLGAAWGSGDFNISTNGSVIQYATGYTACGVGTGTYQLDAAVTRIQ